MNQILSLSSLLFTVLDHCSKLILLQREDLRCLVVTQTENVEKLLQHCRVVERVKPSLLEQYIDLLSAKC